MRTLHEIRTSGRLLQALSAAAVLLFALVGLGVQQPPETWLDPTAIAALLGCASGFLAVAAGSPRIASALAMVAITGGLAALDQSGSLGRTDHAGIPGLLADVVALSTLLGGLAIVAAAWVPHPRRRIITVVSIGSIIVALGLAGVIHDLAPGADHEGPALGLTVWRALLLVALGTAVIAVARPVRRRRHPLSRWLFVPATLAVAAGAILLAQLIRLQEFQQMREVTATTIERIHDQLDVRLDASLLGLNRMARSWNWRGRPARHDWKTDAWLFVDHFAELHAVSWVDDSTRVRWLAPLAGSHALQHQLLDAGAAHRATLDRARTEDTLALSDPLELYLGQDGFIAAAPVSPRGEPEGFIVGFYRFGPLLESVVETVAPGFVVKLVHDGAVLYRSQPEEPSDDRWRRRMTFEAYGGQWQLVVGPRAHTIQTYLTWLPGLTLAIGLGLAGLVGIAVYQAEASRVTVRRLAREVRRRSRVESALRRSQRDLEARVRARTADLHDKQTELERSNAELERLATIDELTGVCNRRRFLELAEGELRRSRRYDRPLTLIMFDLDRFKRLNDSHGHAAGDAVLSEAAACAAAGLRETDCLARYGGEEFVVLLSESTAQQGRAVAERMRAALEGLAVEHGDREHRFTASFGVATLETGDADIEALLERADRALYEAKNAGRNRVVFLES